MPFVPVPYLLMNYWNILYQWCTVFLQELQVE